MPTMTESEAAVIKRQDREIARMRDRCRQLLESLKDILPLAEDYLEKAPGHPDNAKLETARALAKLHI